MPKDTISLTFNSRIPYTVTRDVRLKSGKVISDVRLNVERVYRDKETRQYHIHAWNVDIPFEDTLHAEEILEVCKVMDLYTIRIADWLKTKGHILHRKPRRGSMPLDMQGLLPEHER